VATSPDSPTRRRRVLLICSAVPALIVAMLAVVRPEFAVRLDNSAYDQVVRWAGTRPHDGRVVIVDIDDSIFW
jgi:CHASE2 domain-containing sensor protein